MRFSLLILLICTPVFSAYDCRKALGWLQDASYPARVLRPALSAEAVDEYLEPLFAYYDPRHSLEIIGDEEFASEKPELYLPESMADALRSFNGALASKQITDANRLHLVHDFVIGARRVAGLDSNISGELQKLLGLVREQRRGLVLHLDRELRTAKPDYSSEVSALTGMLLYLDTGVLAAQLFRDLALQAPEKLGYDGDLKMYVSRNIKWEQFLESADERKKVQHRRIIDLLDETIGALIRFETEKLISNLVSDAKLSPRQIELKQKLKDSLKNKEDVLSSEEARAYYSAYFNQDPLGEKPSTFAPLVQSALWGWDSLDPETEMAARLNVTAWKKIEDTGRQMYEGPPSSDDGIETKYRANLALIRKQSARRDRQVAKRVLTADVKQARLVQQAVNLVIDNDLPGLQQLQSILKARGMGKSLQDLNLPDGRTLLEFSVSAGREEIANWFKTLN